MPLETPSERALRACELLKAAYDNGRKNGDHIDWSDVDRAYEVALSAVRAQSRLDRLRERGQEPQAAVVVQEGGSSGELYVHCHDRTQSAERNRLECAKRGSYRTGPVVPVPKDLAQHPAFSDTVEAIVKSVSEIDYPASVRL